MSSEAMKLALRRAFNLGQTYWQQADSEYSSHWKKADVTKASFEQLVEETCQAIEQAQQAEPTRSQKMRDAGITRRPKGWDKELESQLAQQAEPVACRACNGSGWVVRDPDIGTDQECFVCEGTGKNIDTSPPPRQWVGMTEDEVDQGLLKTGYAMKTAEAWRHGVEWAQFNLMRKNT